MLRDRRLATTLLVAVFALVGLVGLAANAFAATTDTADVTATVIAPIAISKTVDLNFGQVVFGAGAGTVAVATNGNRSKTGSGILGNGGGTAASFDVTGEGTNTFSITYPTSDVTLLSGTDELIVNTFVISPTSPGTLVAGAKTVLVGATLNSLGSQPAGTYEGTFDVSVAYN